MSLFKKLMGEAHQRALWQIVGIYLAASWVVLQVIGQIADSLVLPEWVEPLAICSPYNANTSSVSWTAR